MLAVVVDTGLGNLRSVEKALENAARQGGLDQARIERTRDPERVRAADRLIVPGQGAFRDTAAALAGGLGEILLERLRAGVPYLGICMGLQVLFESSEEAPGVEGLGWFRGRVARLSGGPGIKIPHMGWNQLVCSAKPPDPIASAGGSGSWFYFVHSFHAVPSDRSVLAATVDYGSNVVTAAVAKDNVLATQFHPEKSQRAGLELLQAFLRGTPA
jgi:imidazole glycerol-phosphate synthase subunit HisH